ncbi:MAG: 16S rRNA (uracil(1498)-N(3))-methyltransferase [Treponema sp.]|jgi:16S rRNA (uracil1498-N3)-methyltransferase|nr:16S rRNA (uracil(1498)-N(3))-methyltransferase [Treponema sp.]
MRQLIVQTFADKDGIVRIQGKEFKYLKQVLRVKIGDMVNIRFPDGSLINSTVIKIDDKNVFLQVCADSEIKKTITRGVQADELSLKNDKNEFCLFQFIPRPQKFELIVRQAVECGVKYIIPVIGEYSEKSSIKSLQESKKDRLSRIIKEARQQSGSPVQTEVSEVMTIDDALSFWNQFSEKKGFILSERDVQSSSLAEQVKSIKTEKIGIAVGSEGGISPNELDLFIKKGLFYPVHFAVNILRCETAALYGIASVQTMINELKM